MKIVSIEDLAKIVEFRKALGAKIIVTSGGYGLIHVGHIRCIQESVKIGKKYADYLMIVIVNGDGFLLRKKGKVFMKVEERMEIIAALDGISYVTSWDDGSQTVVGALELLKPDYFTKGGDRSTEEAVPEFEVCKKIGCEVVFGVGGTEKVQSSSNLIENIQK